MAETAGAVHTHTHTLYGIIINKNTNAQYMCAFKNNVNIIVLGKWACIAQNKYRVDEFLE